MEVIPLAPETSVQSLTASSSQSLTHLGHRYEKVIAVDSAKVHLGDVYGGTHTHIHQEAATAAEAPLDPLSTVPFPRDLDYVRRDSLIDEIHAKLSVPGARVALVGLGGVGKSQLAIDYAYQVRDDSPSTWVLWLHASSAARLEQSIRNNLDDLKVPGRADAAANLFQLLRGWLKDSRNGKWLLILDNVDDAQYLLEPPSSAKQDAQQGPHQERILDYLPSSSHGSILLTSRTRDSALKVVERKAIIDVEQMGPEHAVELLDKKLDCEHTREEALELARALDLMPLAINQAAAYISQEWPRCSVKQYLEKLATSDISKFSLLNLDDGDLRRDREATNSIISTWQISFDQIRRVRPSAANLISLMCFFDRQSIPESVLRQRETSSQTPGDISETNAGDFDLDVKMLRSYSFISAVTADTFTMHSLVQFATRRWLEARSEEEFWNGRFVDHLDVAFPEHAGYEDWNSCAALYPHVKAAQNLKPTDRSSSKVWAHLLCSCAIYAWDKGLRADAYTMATLSADELVRLGGQEMAFRSMRLLAYVTMYHQSPDTAGNLQAQVVEKSEKIHGEDSEITLECKGVLAESYRRQGRLEEAESMQAGVLATLGRLLGDEDSRTLVSMADLARVYHDQGSHQKAMNLDEQVFEVQKRVLGLEHMATLGSMSNLALSYERSGLYEKAAALGTQTLAIERKVLGSEHPNTLNTMGILALTFAAQESYDKAIPLAEETLEVRRKTLGPEHPHTLSGMNTLAYIYNLQKSHEKAIELEFKVFEISKRVLGPEHPDTLHRMDRLANIYNLQKSHEKAIELEFKVFEISERVLGPEHPDTLDRMYWLALLFYSAGRQPSARGLMELCAARSDDGLGPEHPDTVKRQRVAEDWSKELECAEQETAQSEADDESTNSLEKS